MNISVLRIEIEEDTTCGIQYLHIHHNHLNQCLIDHWTLDWIQLQLLALAHQHDLPGIVWIS